MFVQDFDYSFDQIDLKFNDKKNALLDVFMQFF